MGKQKKMEIFIVTDSVTGFKIGICKSKRKNCPYKLYILSTLPLKEAVKKCVIING